MSFPKVTVLVLSFNGRHLLEDCLNSYCNNGYKRFSILVIDNGSTDETEDYVRSEYPSVKVLRSDKNLKYSGGLNFGLDYAFSQENADYALITNNDVVADSDLIAALVDAAQNDNSIGFTIGKVYYYEKPEVFQTVGKKYDPVIWNGGHIGQGEKDTGQYDKVEERAWCDDIYWLVRREVWERTGGYDTEFAFQGEDFDWQVRAKRLGYKIMFTPHAKLWHKESMTIGRTSPFKAYYDARNPLIVHMKHREQHEYMPIIKMRFLGNLKVTPKMLLKGKILHLFKMWRGFFSAISWGIRNKKLFWA